MRTRAIISNVTPWLSLGILCFVAFVSFKLWNAAPHILMNTERITEIRQDSTRHWQDEQERTHGTVRLAQADAQLLQAAFPKLDSIMQVLDIKLKQLQTVTTASSYTSGMVRPTVEQVHRGEKTLQAFTYRDRFLDLSGIVGDDSSFVRYGVSDSLVFTTYWKRKWLLGRKDFFIDGYSLNPNSHIVNLTGLKVATQQPKRFGLGPYIGFGYDGQEWKPSIGLSLQYAIVKF